MYRENIDVVSVVVGMLSL